MSSCLLPYHSVFLIIDMETSYTILFLWNIQFQLSIQHDIHISLLQDVGRRFLPRKNSWFYIHVHFWLHLNCGNIWKEKKTFLSYKFLLFIFPDLCLVCQFTLPRTLTYNHACICVGKAKSICQNELFWPLTISCKYYIVIYTQSHKILTALKIYCRLPIYLGYLLLSQCYWATVC